MDSSRFDAWTRRRFGIAAGGLLTGLFAVAQPDNVDARNKRKRKKRRRRKSRDEAPPPPQPKCLPLRSPCPTFGQTGICCDGLLCGEVFDISGNVCCKTLGATCAISADCCGNTTCDLKFGVPGKACCTPAGFSCEGNEDCCLGLGCKSGKCEMS